MVDEALHLAARGFRVLPVHMARNGVCTCKPTKKRPKAGAECDEPGKHACIRKWQENATTDPKQIERWWRTWPEANVAILCGDDLVVVDVDGSRGAAALHKALAGRPWPKTLQARTGRQEGGLHALISRSPEGLAIESSRGGGIEVQYTGRYVIAPPSLHKSGNRYQWIKDALGHELPMSAIPEWLVEALDAREKEGRQRAPKTSAAGVPEHLRKAALPRLADRAAAGMEELPDPDDLAAVVALIPNKDREWDDFNRILMAIWAASAGAEYGKAIGVKWS